MLYQILNAKILTPLEETAGAVVVRDGRFAEISARPLDGVPSVDARGLYLAPGFIDLHVHGGGRCTPSSSSAKGSGRRSFAPAPRRAFYQRCGRSCFWLARGCGSMRARRKTPCRSRRKRRAALPRSAAPRRAPRRV